VRACDEEGHTVTEVENELHRYFGESTRLRADARRNRERVIDAALEIFAENGALSTMEQVAERAGVAKGTVYRSFPNKDVLLYAVTATQFAHIQKLAERAVRNGANPVEAFVDLIHEVFEYNRENGLFIEVIRRGHLPAEVVDLQMKMRVALAVAMDRCRPAGVISEDITPDDLFVLMGGIAIRLTLNQASEDEWRRGVELVLRGLGFPVPVSTSHHETRLA
jgi:AcrR family transcriptional regulator